MKGLYIHIPFCLSKCLYCDFNSYAGKLALASPYVSAVLKEAEKFSGSRVDTVYIGGGTPTALPLSEIERLICGIKKYFDIDKAAEFTVEMNPKTADREYLKTLKEMGVNRISIGAQSFNDDILKRIGRAHKSSDIYSAAEACHAADIENYSLDLMFSLPGQTMKDWTDTLENALKCEPKHISSYGLKIEPGTPFYEKGVQPLSEELDREMYHFAADFFAENGFIQYEISNFALKGRESLHNLKYWRCEEYFGLGAGAHGYITDSGKKVRSANVKPIEEYILKINENGTAAEEKNILTKEDILTEKIIMGLRLTEGIPQELVSSEKAALYIKNGFMERVESNIRFTLKGFDVSNTILSDLI